MVEPKQLLLDLRYIILTGSHGSDGICERERVSHNHLPAARVFTHNCKNESRGHCGMGESVFAHTLHAIRHDLNS